MAVFDHQHRTMAGFDSIQYGATQHCGSRWASSLGFHDDEVHAALVNKSANDSGNLRTLLKMKFEPGSVPLDARNAFGEGMPLSFVFNLSVFPRREPGLQKVDMKGQTLRNMPGFRNSRSSLHRWGQGRAKIHGNDNTLKFRGVH